MNRHFRSQVRLSCDGKLTRNRANSNFHPQPAIVVLAPICFDEMSGSEQMDDTGILKYRCLRCLRTNVRELTAIGNR